MRRPLRVDDGVGDASVTIKNGGVNVAGDGLSIGLWTPHLQRLATPPGSPSSLCALQSSRGVRFRKNRPAPGDMRNDDGFPTWSGRNVRSERRPTGSATATGCSNDGSLAHWIWKSS